jgi:hypothetical protein
VRDAAPALKKRFERRLADGALTLDTEAQAKADRVVAPAREAAPVVDGVGA